MSHYNSSHEVELWSTTKPISEAYTMPYNQHQGQHYTNVWMEPTYSLDEFMNISHFPTNYAIDEQPYIGNKQSILEFTQTTTDLSSEYFATIKMGTCSNVEMVKEEKITLYCDTCNQSFKTKLSFCRHLNSRKHEINASRKRKHSTKAVDVYRKPKNYKQKRLERKLSILPDGMITCIIHNDQLYDDVINKSEFFSNIELTDAHDILDAVLPTLPLERSVMNRYINIQDSITPSNLLDTSLNKKMCPCKLCFQTLYSKEAFEQHLQEKHLSDLHIF